jgi:hypothetical protein
MTPEKMTATPEAMMMIDQAKLAERETPRKFFNSL